jgi:hypothetical protein
VSARGKRMQFWADILLNHPELVPEVPKDAVAMLWGYEADHPFEDQTQTLADAGLPFYVCPGTSSWQSIGGRINNMFANVHSAAHWGAKRGARGLLVTDWGDRGHLQPPFVSLPGYMFAAEAAWNPDARRASSTALLGPLSRHVLSHDLAEQVIELGWLAGGTRMNVRNASPFSLLLTKFDAPFPPPELVGLDPSSLEGAEVLARGVQEYAMGQVGNSHGRQPLDGELLLREIRWTAGLLRFACELGIARLRAGHGSLDSIDKRESKLLAEELTPLISEHRELWLQRSRPGGLDRSARWLERILDALNG